MGTAIEDVLWPGMHRLAPKSKLGGILARKRGYHNSRDHLPAEDYSVAQFAVDRQGPATQGSAIDWTFPDAQAGNYATIKVFSRRLYGARNDDPRAIYMREFFGNTDDDREVEGWDYAKNRASTSDSSHLWHIHISIHRKYINDAHAMRAILSILAGETVAQWEARIKRKVVMIDISGKLPELVYGDNDPVTAGGTTWIRRAQRELQVTADGEYGDQTAAALKKVMATDPNRSSDDGRKIGLAEWRRLYGIW